MESYTNNTHTTYPRLEGIPIDNTSPQVEESSGYDSKIPYAISHEEVNSFRCITREYTRQIGVLPTTPFLPRRRGVVKSIVSTSEHTLVHTVEDLVDIALQ
jgi:hypothetical protein